jgi:predicted small secreted protein
MKKTLFTILVAGTMLSLSSCDTYRGLGSATSLAQLSSNSFLQNIAKSVISNITGVLTKGGVSSLPKLGLNTGLSSLLTTPALTNGFKSMLGSSYGIPTGIIDKNFGGLGNIKDVVGMVAGNATKGLNF